MNGKNVLAFATTSEALSKGLWNVMKPYQKPSLIPEIHTEKRFTR